MENQNLTHILTTNVANDLLDNYRFTSEEKEKFNMVCIELVLFLLKSDIPSSLLGNMKKNEILKNFKSENKRACNIKCCRLSKNK